MKLWPVNAKTRKQRVRPIHLRRQKEDILKKPERKQDKIKL